MSQQNNDVKIFLSEETLEALRDVGAAECPESLTVSHREATVREVDKFRALEAENRGKDSIDWFAALLKRRVVEDVELVVVQEAMRDLTQTQIACHVAAYISGEMPEEKKMAKATRRITSGMMEDILDSVSSGHTPSPVQFTTSAKKK